MAAAPLHKLAICGCLQLPELPKFQWLAIGGRHLQASGPSSANAGPAPGWSTAKCKRARPGAAASGEPALDLLLDLADAPSEWHAPDTWKESLGGLCAAASTAQLPHEYYVAKVRDMLNNLGDGHMSVSAYDTAWVAMVPALEGCGENPQFPGCLDWIMQHQLSDGSWGEPSRFCVSDRVVSTLACVLALATWGVGAAKVKRACEFVARNLDRIGGGDDESLVGSEMVLPALIQEAKKLGLELPYQSVTCHQLMLKREHRMTEIDMDSVHSRPTAVLHSLEGVRDVVDWERIMKLQSPDGSFSSSPASTACALIHTRDPMCLQYLTSVLDRFDNAAVPSVYPVDIFQRLWVVDRLQRLGIGRHFQEEMKMCLDYVYQHWREAGGVARGVEPLLDLDSTAMGFRLLRLHGYRVSQDVFLPFKRADGFCCLSSNGDDRGGRRPWGQAMFNLYRASQTRFPGETVLEQGAEFSRTFLVNEEEKWRASHLSKDLPGEVDYSLTHPFHASLPRIETRAYLDQYGSDDVWIGKSLYLMPYVQNPVYLALAKADFNLCQKQHQEDLEYLVRWNAEHEFEKLDFARQKIVECFFSAAATMHEPQLRSARRVWAQNAVLTTVVDDYFDMGTPIEHLRQFKRAVDSWDPSLIDSNNERQRITFMAMYNSVNAMAADAKIAQGRDVSNHLIALYKRCVGGFWMEAEWAEERRIPPWEEYLTNGEASIAADTVMIPPMFFVGEQLSDSVLAGEDFKRLRWNVDVVGRLLNDIQGYKREAAGGKANGVLIHMTDHPHKTEEEVLAYLRQMVDNIMQQVTQDVLLPSQVPHACKKLFWHMATCLQLFYRNADGYSSLTAMKEYVKTLLFQPVT